LSVPLTHIVTNTQQPQPVSSPIISTTQQPISSQQPILSPIPSSAQQPQSFIGSYLTNAQQTHFITSPYTTAIHVPLPATTYMSSFAQPTIYPVGYPPPPTGTNTTTKPPFSYSIPTPQTPYPFCSPSFNNSFASNGATYTTPPQTNFRSPKVEMNTFDGTDPLEWLFQADQFFAFYNINQESRLPMASFYMKGEALSWYKWMYQNNQITDWESFARSLELRFGPSTYENHQEQLFKLRQQGSVADYQSSFERLGNRVLGLPHDALLNCFISVLIPEIRHELAIQRPFSISQAIGLAKLIEAKIKDSKTKFPRPYIPTTTPQTTQLYKNPSLTYDSSQTDLPTYY
jgi:hypothetical protein